MKRSPIAALAAVALLAGCASVSEPKLLQPLTKVTLVSVVANDKLYYVGDQPPQASLVDMALNSATNDGKGNAGVNKLLEKTDVFVVKAEEQLAEALNTAKGSSLIPKDTLFASSAYTKAPEEMLGNSVALRPAGYRFIKITDKTLSSVANEVGANGVIVARFLFQKAMSMGMMGTGTLGAQTSLTIQAFDAAGKMVFTKIYVAVSKSNTGVVANVYDPAKYEPVVVESAQMAVDKFAADLAAAR